MGNGRGVMRLQRLCDFVYAGGNDPLDPKTAPRDDIEAYLRRSGIDTRTMMVTLRRKLQEARRDS